MQGWPGVGRVSPSALVQMAFCGASQLPVWLPVLPLGVCGGSLFCSHLPLLILHNVISGPRTLPLVKFPLRMWGLVQEKHPLPLPILPVIMQLQGGG